MIKKYDFFVWSNQMAQVFEFKNRLYEIKDDKI